MPLSQRDQKRAILHARARAYEDAARELRRDSSLEALPKSWETRAALLRANADATIASPIDGRTVDEIVRTYCTKAEHAANVGHGLF
jgi:hypothetical protein